MSFWEGPSNCILVHKLKDVKGRNSLLAGKSTSFSNYIYPRRFQVKEMWFQNKTEKKKSQDWFKKQKLRRGRGSSKLMVWLGHGRWAGQR